MYTNLFKTIASLFLSAFILLGCGKSESGSSNSGTTIDSSSYQVTQEKYDSTNLGVYVGFFVGSTGTAKAVIDNGTGKVVIYLSITPDGKPNFSDTLTTTSSIPVTGSYTANFTGKHGSSLTWSITKGNGVNPTITNIVVPGEPSTTYVALAKTTLTNKVYVYRGNFTATSEDNKVQISGVFNIIRYNTLQNGVATPTVFGVIKPTSSPNHFYTDAQIASSMVGISLPSGWGYTILPSQPNLFVGNGTIVIGALKKTFNFNGTFPTSGSCNGSFDSFTWLDQKTYQGSFTGPITTNL